MVFSYVFQQMPLMNGFEATREIRKIEKERKTKNPIVIIGLSGNAREAFAIQGVEAGMNDYIVRP